MKKIGGGMMQFKPPKSILNMNPKEREKYENLCHKRSAVASSRLRLNGRFVRKIDQMKLLKLTFGKPICYEAAKLIEKCKGSFENLIDLMNDKYINRSEPFQKPSNFFENLHEE